MNRRRIDKLDLTEKRTQALPSALVTDTTKATDFSPAEAAQRAGVDEAYVEQLISLGVVEASPNKRLRPAGVRAVQLSRTLDNAGIPLEGMAALIRRGELSLAFLDTPAYERFAALS